MARGRKRKISKENLEKLKEQELNEIKEQISLSSSSSQDNDEINPTDESLLFRKALEKFVKTDLLPSIISKFEPTVIPTGIKPLDTILGGGFFTSLFSKLVSPPETGKSTIALQASSNFLKNNDKALVLYIDTESPPALLPGQEEFPIRQRLEDFGIPKDDPRFIYAPGIKTFTEVFDVIKKFIDYKINLEKQFNLSKPIPSLIIWDSIADTIPDISAEEAEKGNPITNPLQSKRSIVLSQILGQISYLTERNNAGVLLLDQVRLVIDLQPGRGGSNKNLNVSQHSNLKSATSVQNVAHKMRHLIFLEKKQEINMDYPGVMGWVLRVYIDKNKIVPSTGMSVDIVFDKSTGINKFWSHFHFLSNRMQYEEKILNKIPKSLQNKYLEYAPLPIQGTKFFHPKIMEQPIGFRSKLDLYRKYQSDEEFRNLFDRVVEQSAKERIESFIKPQDSFWKKLVELGEIGREDSDE